MSDVNVEFYPNPAHDELKVDVKNNSSVGELMVTNALGQVVYRMKLDAEKPERISVATWASGVYFVSVIGGREFAPQKLIISH